MKNSYDDIRAAAGEPLWWDENGVPRYAEFSTDHLANIYAHEAALAEITCQGCGKPFQVAFSRSSLDRKRSLREEIETKELHYGDPPNEGCCLAGPTMNSEPRRVIQYWWRAFFGHDLRWQRDERLEIDIKPDWVGE